MGAQVSALEEGERTRGGKGQAHGESASVRANQPVGGYGEDHNGIQRGKRLGRGFVRFLVNLILEKEAGVPCLWCVVGNNKARQLYDSLGFEEVFREAFAWKKLPDGE